VGDFAMAGASFLTTIHHLKAPYVALETGQYGWQRLAGGITRWLHAPGRSSGRDAAWQMTPRSNSPSQPQGHPFSKTSAPRPGTN